MTEEALGVLVVHPDDEEREQWKGLLAGGAKELGFTVHEAAAAQEAVDHCQNQPPACVVIPQTIGDTDAEGFLDALSGGTGELVVPVIVVMEQLSRKALNKILGAGAADWLPKNHVSTVLDRVVRYALESRTTRERLVEQRVLFGSLVMCVPGLLAVKSPDLQYVVTNPAFHQFVGKAPEEIQGETDAALFSKSDAKELKKEDKKVLDTGVQHTCMHQVKCALGDRWIEVTRNPMMDGNGNVTGLLWAARDITELKEMEESVRASQESYLALAEDQSELTCRFDPEMAITFANGPLCRFLGKSEKELRGESFLSIMPEEEEEGMQKHLSGLSKDKPVGAHELGAVAAEGDIRWLEWTTRALFSEDGALLGYQAVGHDHTASKRAEDALADRDAKLAELQAALEAKDQEFAGVGEQLEAKDGEIAALNEQVSAKDGEIAALNEQVSAKDGEIAALTEQVTAKDGELEALGQQVAEKDGQLAELTQVQETLNATLAAAQQRFDSLAALLPLAMCELDTEFKLQFANPAALELLGLKKKDVEAGPALIDTFHDEDKQAVQDLLGQAAGGHAPEPGEFRMPNAAGEEVLVELTCAPIPGNDGAAGVWCCLSDLVGRQQMEEAFQATNSMAAVAATSAVLTQVVSAGLAGTLGKWVEGEDVPGPDPARLGELKAALDKLASFSQQLFKQG